MRLKEGGEMPKETFWPETAVEGDDSQPTLTISWHGDVPCVFVNGVRFDRSGMNRLIRVARRARDWACGADE